MPSMLVYNNDYSLGSFQTLTVYCFKNKDR